MFYLTKRNYFLKKRNKPICICIGISTTSVLPPILRLKTRTYPMSIIEMPLSEGHTEGIT